MMQRSSETTNGSGRIRVLVVDDSAFMRHLITRELATDPGIEVIGAASDGLEAIASARDLRPDVVTLDIEMPRLDGLGALPRILEACPARVIMLSSNEGVGRANTVRALELGAVDFILKPTGVATSFGGVRETLLRAVHNAASATVRSATVTVASHGGVQKMARSGVQARRLVIIGASTGGPQALTAVVPLLPPDTDAAFIVVQHMPAGFTTSLAARLNDLSAIHVREAAAGDVLVAGEALVAPGDYHLRIATGSGGPVIRLDQGPRVHGVRPSVDVALASAAEAMPGRIGAAVLTGMGRDGAAGALAVRQANGWVIAQDAASCVIFGMPRSVIEAGAASAVVPLDEIAHHISTLLAAPPTQFRRGA
jgi:two-component system chemotaxis response regulator CheB